MTDQKNKSSHAGEIVAAGLAGAALGAAGVYLSDKKNQKEVVKKLDKVRNWSEKTVSDWKEKGVQVAGDASEVAEEISAKSAEVKEDVKDQAEDLKN